LPTSGVKEKFKLVLSVCLHDPFTKELSTIEQLLLLDGYDLFPQDMKDDSLIADILNCKILASCTIIVSSRPNASTSLHSLADIKVDILCFTEKDSKEYIKQALEGQPEKTQI